MEYARQFQIGKHFYKIKKSNEESLVVPCYFVVPNINCNPLP